MPWHSCHVDVASEIWSTTTITPFSNEPRHQKIWATSRENQQNELCARWRLRSAWAFHFFRIWISAKLRPMINVILQSLCLDLVNINYVCKSLSKYSKWFKSCGHFSRIVRSFANGPGTDKRDYRVHWKSTFNFFVSWLSMGRAISAKCDWQEMSQLMRLWYLSTSEGSVEPAHPHSLARAFAVRTHQVWK